MAIDLETCKAQVNAQALQYARDQVSKLLLDCPTPGTCIISTVSPLSSGSVGTSYSYQLIGTVTGLPVAWSKISGTLPPGLSLSSGGLISGTPTTAGTYDFTVKLQGGSGISSRMCTKNLEIIITDTPPPCPPPAGSRWFYWTMQEAGYADRVDSVVGLHLRIDLVTPGFGVYDIGDGPGLYGNGLRFMTGTNGSVFLGTLDPYSQLRCDGLGFSICGWFNISAWPPITFPFPGQPTGLRIGYISYNSGSPLLMSELALGTDTFGHPVAQIIMTNGPQADNPSIPIPTAGDWHFFHMFLDNVLHKMGFEIDGGAPTYASFTPIMPPAIPCSDQGKVVVFQDVGGVILPSVVDEIAVRLDKRFTPAQVAYLYNGGAGQTWPITLP